ncbi:MAG: hypothetical protein IAA89_04615 [Firmicutes bacterium]|uniref:CopG family transcriptional regulator n=1 Tax=Candidatus Gallilactobacillus intestinavium TaxID=2840838 RepID=A0A9D9E8B7_9LACO|nr:hypothetical protein [Candidatus Gallilactobacillus intestinavium]
MKNVTRSVKLSFDEKTYNIICKQAKLDGKTASEFMQSAILEKLEDLLDYQDAVKAMHEFDGKTVSREEIMKELGRN